MNKTQRSSSCRSRFLAVSYIKPQKTQRIFDLILEVIYFERPLAYNFYVFVRINPKCGNPRCLCSQRARKPANCKIIGHNLQSKTLIKLLLIRVGRVFQIIDDFRPPIRYKNKPLGRRGGLALKRRTPEREVRVRSSLRSLCCVLEQDTFTSKKYWLYPGCCGSVPT